MGQGLKRLNVIVSLTNRLSGPAAQAYQSFYKLNQGARRAADGFAALTAKSALVAAAVAGVFALTAREAIAFESSLAEVGTLTNASAEQMRLMSDEVKRLGIEFGALPVDVSRALYQTQSAGFTDIAAASDLLTAALKLARGGVTDTKTAVDGLTSTLNAYSLTGADAGRISDQFFTAVKAGKTTIGELASSIGRVAPLASSAGVSTQELFAATAALTLSGQATAEAISAQRGAITAIIKPTAEAEKLAQKLGLDFGAAALKAKGFAAFLEDVREKTLGSTEVMAQLFGSVEGLNAVLALTGPQAKQFGVILDQMNDSAGATDEAFSRMARTMQFQIDTLRASFSALLIESFEPMKPAFDALAEGLNRVVAGVGAWVRANPDLAQAAVYLGLAVGALAALGVALGLFGQGAAIVVSGLAVLGGGLAVARASMLALGDATLFALGVWGLIIAGFAAGAWAINKAIDNWDMLKEGILQVLRAITGAITDFIDTINSALPEGMRAATETALGFWRRLNHRLDMQIEYSVTHPPGLGMTAPAVIGPVADMFGLSAANSSLNGPLALPGIGASGGSSKKSVPKLDRFSSDSVTSINATFETHVHARELHLATLNEKSLSDIFADLLADVLQREARAG